MQYYIASTFGLQLLENGKYAPHHGISLVKAESLEAAQEKIRLTILDVVYPEADGWKGQRATAVDLESLLGDLKSKDTDVGHSHTVYAASLYAHRVTGPDQTVETDQIVLIAGKRLEVAEQIALNALREFYPAEEGWVDQHAIMRPLSELLEMAAN